MAGLVPSSKNPVDEQRNLKYGDNGQGYRARRERGNGTIVDR